MDLQLPDSAMPETALAVPTDFGWAPALPIADLAQGEAFGEAEAAFIAARDSFYLATVDADGWPHVQQRGGPIGMIEAVDAHTLSFPDYRGPGRCVSRANIRDNPRVCLTLVDYEQGIRLKILGAAWLIDLTPEPPRDGDRRDAAKPERQWVIRLERFAWNRRQYMPRRFSEARVRGVVGSLQAQIRRLRHRLAGLELAR